MRRKAQIHWISLVVVAASIVGCATPQTRTPNVSSVAAQNEALEQKKLVVRTQIENSNRLARVAHSVLVAGASLCKDKVGPKYGFLLLSEDAFDEEFVAAARAEGFSKAVEVSYVISGSKSEETGLAVGDELKRIDGWEVPDTDKDPLKAVLEKLESAKTASSVLALTVARNGVDTELSIPAEQACKYPVVIGTGDDVNAYADGDGIVVEKGMMRFAHDDEELALVIAHELAHNAMGHIKAKKTNMVIGGALGLVLDVALAAATYGAYSEASFTQLGMQAGAGSYSVAFEQEADYVGMYFLKRAGYDISEAPDFWRRMAIEHPESIELRRSHPTTPERFVALESTITEIDNKLSTGHALVPEMKE